MSEMFKVDRDGLAKLLRNQGLHRMFEELISNAMDESVTFIKVVLEPSGTHMEYRFSVEDDSPEGFKNLDHAYTLFADSYKKGNPEQRGRFNFGEKWVIAVCKSAKITSTTGTIIFEGDERRSSRQKRTSGTLFEGFITSTLDEVASCLERLKRIIVDDTVKFTVNGIEMPKHVPVATFEATLPTVIPNEAGELVRSERKSVVKCYSVGENERPTVYEMGIPVVSLDPKSGDPWHYNVMQKVPLSMNRDNVPPRFLVRLRTESLNHTFRLLSKEQAASNSVTEAMKDAVPEAVEVIITHRFGEKRAIFDPSDIESNARLASEGYTVIPGGTFDKQTWSNIKTSGAALPSGTVRPTPKPYSESGKPVQVITELTPGMQRLKAFIVLLGREACKRTLHVTFVNAPHNRFGMCCGKTGSLDVNLGVLGHKWIDGPPAREQVINILLDEFGHLVEENHLSERYYKELRRAGAAIAMLMLQRPELFLEFR